MDQKLQKKNLFLDEEIHFEEILRLLSVSKKLVIIITIICVCLTTSFAYYIKPTLYHGSAKILIGSYEEIVYGPTKPNLIPLINPSLILNEIRLFYKRDFDFIGHEESYIELNYIGNSQNEVNSFLNKLTQFILEKSEDSFSKINNRLNLEHDDIKDNIEFINNEINKRILIDEFETKLIQESLKLIENDLLDENYDPEILYDLRLRKGILQDELARSDFNASLRSEGLNKPGEVTTFNYVSDLFYDLKAKRKLLKKQESIIKSSMNNILKTRLTGPIEIIQVDKKIVLHIFAGFFLGIALSTAAIFIKYGLFKNDS